MAEENEDKTIMFGAGPGAAPAAPAAAAVQQPRARLVCLDTSLLEGGAASLTISLVAGQQIVGRGDDCSTIVACRRLSRQHARLFAGAGAWGIEDMDSTNGVFVNGARVKTAWLAHGSEVKLGPLPFRYEVERPATAVHHPMPAAASHDDDGEHTMILGSLGASNAVLDAARKAEPVAVAPATPAPAGVSRVGVPPPVAAGRAGAQAKRAGSRLPLYATVAVVVAGLAGGLAVYLPELNRQREVADVDTTGDRMIKDIAARTRDRVATVPAGASVGASGTDRYEADQEMLAPLLEKARRLLAADPANVKLASIYARVRFLSFEREFVGLLAPNRLDEASRLCDALAGELKAVAAGLPSGALDKDRETVIGIQDLTAFARLVVDYRRFALSYGAVTRDVAKRPPAGEIAGLDGRKGDFIRYRRSLNARLQTDYLLFYGVVDTVDKQDIPLLGHWKDVVASPG